MAHLAPERVVEVGRDNHYIRPKAPPDGATLGRTVEWAVNDYNEVRPHSSLKGLTPTEAYSGLGVESLAIAEKVNTARLASIQANRRNTCKPGC